MIHEVVLAGLDILGSTEVHTVLLADVLDLLVCASQADDTSVELFQVLAQHLGRITDGIASNKNGHEELLVSGSGVDLIDDLGHLVQLIGADIGAVREAEVDLEKQSEIVLANTVLVYQIHWSSPVPLSRITHEAVFALQVLCRKLVPIKILQDERTANLRLANTLAHLRHALALKTGLLNTEVEHHTGTGQDEEQCGLPREWAGRVALAHLAHCLGA